MILTIKIECGCGQHYAFDVEADGALEAGTVVCPTCGADGTNAANAIITKNLAATPVAKERIYVIPPPPSPRVVAPAPPPLPTARVPAAAPGIKEDERNQAEVEAKAKILWGDPPEEVIRFLMIRGFNRQEASDKVRAMFRARLAAIRANGIGKMLMGVFVAFGSSGFFFLQIKYGFISLWLLLATGVACVSGLWLILDGLLKVLMPKLKQGDASEND
jgi:uncharacterized protein YjeT (DUF2065 family)